MGLLLLFFLLDQVNLHPILQPSSNEPIKRQAIDKPPRITGKEKLRNEDFLAQRQAWQTEEATETEVADAICRMANLLKAEISRLVSKVLSLSHGRRVLMQLFKEKHEELVN
jgi:hypothetical protein